MTDALTRSSLRLVKPCSRCELWPCACSHIVKLAEGGELAHLRQAAIDNYRLPMPHRSACPCPRCYSLRLATWAADPTLEGAS